MTQPGSDQRLTVAAPSGRMLEILTAGPEDGLPLVFHTGTPAGLVGLGPMAQAAAARGLRTVLCARPGYGDSTPQPGRLVADAAADVAAILDRPLGHATPVAIWQGAQDRMVPSAHGEWLAANIPLARARLRPGEGHLTLIAKRFGEILDDVLALAGKS